MGKKLPAGTLPSSRLSTIYHHGQVSHIISQGDARFSTC
jgi:hypothetical protein